MGREPVLKRKTQISYKTEEKTVLRGHNLSDLAEEGYTFCDALFVLFQGRIPTEAEEKMLELKPGGGSYTMREILEVSAWMQAAEVERLEKGDTLESREQLAASLPLVGEKQFGEKKCLSYCDVEPLCSGLVRKYGRPEVSFEEGAR